MSRIAAACCLLFTLAAIALGGLAGGLVAVDLSLDNHDQLDRLACYTAQLDHQAPRGDRVLNPPEARKFATILVTSPNWKSDPIERQVVAWFEPGSGNPELASLRTTTEFLHYTTDQKLYRERFAGTMGTATPIVQLQDWAGRTYYNADRTHIPATSELLVNRMIAAAGLVHNRQAEQCGPDGCRPPADSPNWQPTGPQHELMPSIIRNAIERRATAALGFKPAYILAIVAVVVAGGVFCLALAIVAGVWFFTRE